jgi:hypothetical protein
MGDVAIDSREKELPLTVPICRQVVLSNLPRWKILSGLGVIEISKIASSPRHELIMEICKDM